MRKTLIVYYTLQGNARRVASALQNQTNGDLFEIELVKPYTLASSFVKGILHTRRGFAPALKNRAENLHEYATIYIGAPVWAFTLTAPVLSFLNEHDLTGKTVIPFVTHDGNPGKYFEKFSKKCPTADITRKMEFVKPKKKSDDEIMAEVKKWLNAIETPNI